MPSTKSSTKRGYGKKKRNTKKRGSDGGRRLKRMETDDYASVSSDDIDRNEIQPSSSTSSVTVTGPIEVEQVKTYIYLINHIILIEGIYL